MTPLHAAEGFGRIDRPGLLTQNKTIELRMRIRMQSGACKWGTTASCSHLSRLEWVTYGTGGVSWKQHPYCISLIERLIM
jgi:hypothetical protein